MPRPSHCHMAVLAAIALNIHMPAAAAAETQPRPDYMDKPAQILTVGTPQPGKTYPLVVFLPFTNGDAKMFYQSVKDSVGLGTYVAVIPAGTVLSGHYLPDFSAFVGWFEQRLLKDIETAKKGFPVDPGKIYLQGYSLGGDLSWALSVRQKELFAGALVIGSRCSWPLGADTLDYMKKQGRRLVFLIGDQDNADRTAGMKAAADKLAAAGVKARYGSFSGAHVIPKAQDLKSACAFLFGTQDR
jgi:predicted peptidase